MTNRAKERSDKRLNERRYVISNVKIVGGRVKNRRKSIHSFVTNYRPLVISFVTSYDSLFNSPLIPSFEPSFDLSLNHSLPVFY